MEDIVLPFKERGETHTPNVDKSQSVGKILGHLLVLLHTEYQVIYKVQQKNKNRQNLEFYHQTRVPRPCTTNIVFHR